MTFRSIHRHGFVRIAACTTLTRIADPEANAEAILNMARVCDERWRRWPCFPELGLSAYAIDDLFLQDALLDAVEAAVGRAGGGTRELLPVLLVGAPLRHGEPPLQLRGGDPPRPDPRRRAEELPAELPRVLREAPVRARRGRRPAGRSGSAGTTAPVRHRPGLRGRATWPASSSHVEICEDVWAPIPPSDVRGAWPAPRCCATCRPRNITIGKADDRRDCSAPSQSARCIAAYVYSAAGPGESTTDLAWDGQAIDLRERRTAGRDRALPDRRARWRVADVDLERLRQERMRTTSFDDAAGDHRRPSAPFRRDRASTSSRRVADVRLRAADRALPVRARRPGAPRRSDCYEAYNIQVAGPDASACRRPASRRS